MVLLPALRCWWQIYWWICVWQGWRQCPDDTDTSNRSCQHWIRLARFWTRKGGGAKLSIHSEGAPGWCGKIWFGALPVLPDHSNFLQSLFLPLFPLHFSDPVCSSGQTFLRWWPLFKISNFNYGQCGWNNIIVSWNSSFSLEFWRFIDELLGWLVYMVSYWCKKQVSASWKLWLYINVHQSPTNISVDIHIHRIGT